MADYPTMPFHTDAYLADTMHLTLEEHGAYMKMLVIAWRSSGCDLPDDDRRIATMLGVTLKRWQEKIRPAIEHFWTIDNGVWYQKKQREVRASVAKNVEQKRNAGRQSAQAKSLKTNNTGSTAVDLPLASRSNNQNQILDSESDSSFRIPESKSESCTESGPSGSPVVDLPAIPFPDPKPDLVLQAFEIWRVELGDVLPKPRKLDPDRRNSLRQVLAGPFENDLTQWRDYCQRIRGSPFLTGNNERGWKADFDFTLKPKKIRKVLEGGYQFVDPALMQNGLPFDERNPPPSYRQQPRRADGRLSGQDKLEIIDDIAWRVIGK